MSSYDDSDITNNIQTTFLVKDKTNGNQNSGDDTFNIKKNRRRVYSTTPLEKPRLNSLKTIEEGFQKSDNESRNMKILHRVKKALPTPI